MSRLRPFLPALLWLLIITVLSGMPARSMPKFDLMSFDKIGHAFVYGVLAFLLCRGYFRNKPPHSAHAGMVGLLLAGAVGYGVLMEFAQFAFFPGRMYELDDMLANALGVVLGWAAWRLLPQRLLP